MVTPAGHGDGGDGRARLPAALANGVTVSVMTPTLTGNVTLVGSEA